MPACRGPIHIFPVLEPVPTRYPPIITPPPRKLRWWEHQAVQDLLIIPKVVAGLVLVTAILVFIFLPALAANILSGKPQNN